MMSSPVSSPAAPAGGWKLARLIPVTSQSISSACSNTRIAPCTSSGGVAGWRSRKAGCSPAQSATLGLYFIVQEPSG